MPKNMQEYVLTLLENYAQKSKEISLMRYELQHTKPITPEEVIEIMSLNRRQTCDETDFPHDVAGIAACFREVTAKINYDLAEEIAAHYITLLRERDRLLHYVSLLNAKQQTVIKEHYFFQKSWTEIAKAMEITRRTVYKIRREAIEELAKLYAFAEDIFK